ncbi:unnamed protein product [Allacma fusca]|uniref:Uncharacterized protein n=1 Tax=Allacma fusca TaxID=39272 RepID=A0A8J2LTA3_9HEXA|nr:unnamed protein product [Allacma fusca]
MRYFMEMMKRERRERKYMHADICTHTSSGESVCPHSIGLLQRREYTTSVSIYGVNEGMLVYNAMVEYNVTIK